MAPPQGDRADKRRRRVGDETVALAVRAADGSVRTVIGKTWDYPRARGRAGGDAVAYSYGDIAGLTDFSIEWALRKE